MLINKRVMLFKILAVFYSTTYALSNKIENCLIGNEKYPNEFLTNDESNRIFLGQSVSVRDLDTIKWSLIQLNDMYDTYYLKNKNTGLYLCSMPIRTKKMYQNFIDSKRSIHLFGPDNLETYDGRRDTLVTISEESEEFLDNCKWKFERAKSDFESSVYVIWNLQFKEPLYAGNLDTRSVKYRRNVFLLNNIPKNQQFKWIVEC
jgi:hypothetical protein